jgi:hypothetical protein
MNGAKVIGKKAVSILQKFEHQSGFSGSRGTGQDHGPSVPFHNSGVEHYEILYLRKYCPENPLQGA